MRVFRLVIVASLLGLFPTAKGDAPEQTSPGASPAFDVRVSVTPTWADRVQLLVRPTPDTFTCAAYVHDAANGKANALLTIVVAPGTSERKSTEAGGYFIRFTATVTADRDRAESEVVISSGSRVVSRQHTSTWLPRQGGSPFVQ